MIGAYQGQPAGRSQQDGKAYVVYGKSTTGTVDLSALSPSEGYTIIGADSPMFDSAGREVDAGTDFNGDGRPDLIIGASLANSFSGASYIIYGFGPPSVIYTPSIFTATVGAPFTTPAPTVKRTGTATFSISPGLPAGLSIDPATGIVSGVPTTAGPPTTFTVTMNDLAGSTTASITIEVDAAAPLVPNANDQLTVQKAEQFIGLGPGETQSVTVSCPPGYEVLDGSPLVQQIDHGLPSFVEIVQSESATPNSYTFTLRNPTSGNAQAKGFVTCVKSTTTDGGAITISDPPVSVTGPFGVPPTTRTLTCPSGTTAVDPGYRFTSGQGRVTASQPTSGLNGWAFTVGGGLGNVTLSIRCLSNKTSDGDLLKTQELVRNVTVPAGQTVSASITCPVGGKGIVASYSLPDGVFLLGNEPQPITRVFSLENTTSSDQTATIDLLCLSNTTWRVAPSVHMAARATVSRTSVNVDVACAAVRGCTGSIALRSGTSLIASGRFAIGARRTAHVHLALTRTGKRLAQERRLHKLTATITTAGGHTTTATVRVKP